ncbi:MAG: phosphomannomutase/phosphoglucomutase [Clostridia bacterium]|nr:phosphomannomutase/phosphoglucomutase [Clostridia bacterium]
MSCISSETGTYDYKKLQNGSDIRGIALEGVEGETPNLGPVEARRLSCGFVLWLSRKTGKKPSALKLAVGRDPRLSGPLLAANIIAAFDGCGCAVTECGLASTPAMFMSTIFPEFACDGAVMITASHLPFNRNGFKYFDRAGGLNKKDISEIIRIAESDEELAEIADAGIWNSSTDAVFDAEISKDSFSPLMERYSLHLKQLIAEGITGRKYADASSVAGRSSDLPKVLSGLKIVVDAGNGSGGFYAGKILAPLGADVSASCFLDPDGHFPNHAPNPEDKKAMAAISRQVIESGADFGLIFDTDVDRSAAVDESGREISRNGIVAMAAALIADDHPGTTVITDSITSNELSEFLTKSLGLKHHRFKRGYKNVINEAVRLNNEGIDSQLAIETSGHAALKENYFLDDGAYLATKIVIHAAKLAANGKKLSTVIAALKEPCEAYEVRFPITEPDFSPYGDRILEELKGFVLSDPGKMSLEEPNYEGVRINFSAENGNGWCLLRKSLHDPIMPLNLESNSKGGCRKMADILEKFLAAYTGLDISGLEKI